MYLITDRNSIYHNIQINDGLNFGNFDLNDFRNIFFDQYNGFDLRKVRLPIEHPDFRIESNRVNMIMIEDRYPLSDVQTWITINNLGLNLKFDFGNPFQWALRNLHLEIIELLIPDYNIHENNEYALRWASRNGHLEIVRLLLLYDADIHAYDDYALRMASKNGHLEIVKLLISCNAKIHANNDYALRWAAQNSHLEIVKLLISFGANIHADYNYALKWASKNEHLEIVKLLISLSNNIS